MNGDRFRVAVTSGDPDGIGLEVTEKALNQISTPRDVQFVCFRAPGHPLNLSKFRVVRLHHPSELPADLEPEVVFEIVTGESAAHWVADAARLCMSAKARAMVTAPLSKTLIRDAGFSEIGHTEILANVSGCEDLRMGFIGDKFSVVLATGHRALREALEEFDATSLGRALHLARELKRRLPEDRREKPIALVGVNPHAGEHGLMGREEVWMREFCRGDVIGPLVPDAAFLPKMWPEVSVFITPYHDQGLIPFKLTHGFGGGVHVTLGLPFIRTSVDHGTAKELFGQNRAEAGSMLDALNTAIRFARLDF